MKKTVKPYVILGAVCHPVWENAVGYKAFEARTPMGRVWFDLSDGKVLNAHWTPRDGRGLLPGIKNVYFSSYYSAAVFVRRADAWLRALAKAGYNAPTEAAPSKSRVRPKPSRRRRRSRTSVA